MTYQLDNITLSNLEVHISLENSSSKCVPGIISVLFFIPLSFFLKLNWNHGKNARRLGRSIWMLQTEEMLDDLKMFLEEWRVIAFKKQVDFDVEVKAIKFLSKKNTRESWENNTAAQIFF